MTLLRTGEGRLEHTNLRYARIWSEKTRTVPSRITVRGHITVLKNFIIQISIRPSFARPISRWGAHLASTRSTVPSRTMKVNFQSSWSKSTKLIWISICSTSRPSGARIARTTTIGKSASTRTTGKTSGGAPPRSSTRARCAPIGKWITSLARTRRAAKTSISACTRTGGKSKNTTRTSSRSSSASTAPTARNRTVRTTTASTTARCPSPRASATSQKRASAPSTRTST